MAREFAQIKLAIWADDDWRDLSPMARYLYLTLLTSPTLTHCGVADWRPARIGALNGMSAEDVEGAGEELAERLYLVIDQESEEVLIRSFIRNDGLMKQPKMAVAMASAHAAVASQNIRGVIVHEAKRLREDFPELSGWGPERAKELLGLRSVDPSTLPITKGSRKGSVKGKATPSGKGSPTPAPTPTPTPSSLSTAAGAADDALIPSPVDRFDEFWDVYGYKEKRADALKAWTKAVRKADPDRILTAASAYVRKINADRARRGERATAQAHASSWLNGERWEDDLGNVHHLTPRPEGVPEDAILLPPLPKGFFDQ